MPPARRSARKSASEPARLARACNQPLGRPKALTDAKATQVRKLAVAGEPVAAIARTFGVGRTTVYRLINADTGED